MWGHRAGVQLGLCVVLALGVGVGGGSVSDLWQTVKQWVFPTVTTEPLPSQCQAESCSATNGTMAVGETNKSIISSVTDQGSNAMISSNNTVLEDISLNSIADGNNTGSHNVTENPAISQSEYSKGNYTSKYPPTENHKTGNIRSKRSLTPTEKTARITLESSPNYGSLLVNDSSKICVANSSIEIERSTNNDHVEGVSHIKDSKTITSTMGVNNTETETKTKMYNGYENNDKYLKASKPLLENINETMEWNMNDTRYSNKSISNENSNDTWSNDTDIFQVNETDYTDIKLNESNSELTNETMNEPVLLVKTPQDNETLDGSNQLSVENDAELHSRERIIINVLNRINSTLSSIKDVSKPNDFIQNDPTNRLKVAYNTTGEKINTLENLSESQSEETPTLVNASKSTSIELSLNNLTNTSSTDIYNSFDKEKAVLISSNQYNNMSIKSVPLTKANYSMKNNGKLKKNYVLTNIRNDRKTLGEKLDWNTSLASKINNETSHITNEKCDLTGPVKQSLSSVANTTSQQQTVAVADNGH